MLQALPIVTPEPGQPARGDAVLAADASVTGGGSPHNRGLDGLRGVAVLLVIFHHLTIVGVGPSSVLKRSLDGLAGYGWVGVDVFFVLSGFLITRILLDRKGDRPVPFFRDFYGRRVVRIFPLYYLCLFTYFFVLPHFPAIWQTIGLDLRHPKWVYWTYLSNFYASRNLPSSYPLLVSWSLAIEEQFYLVWPFAIYACSTRRAAGICVALLLIAALARCLAVLWHGPWYAIYFSTPTRLDGLAMGSLLAIYVNVRGGPPRLGRARLAFWIALALLVAACLQAHFRHVTLRDDRWVGQPVGYTLVSAVAASAIGMVLHDRFRWLRSGALVFFGKYSYSLYLLHYPIALLVHRWFGTRRIEVGDSFASQMLFYATCMSLNVGASLLTWSLWEVHWLRLKRYFRSGPPIRARAAVGTP